LRLKLFSFTARQHPSKHVHRLGAKSRNPPVSKGALRFVPARISN
jgi:hypothetical protein